MNSFTKQLIERIGASRDNLRDLIERMRQEKKVCIWGTGVAGQMICNTLKKWGINTAFFINGGFAPGTVGTLLEIPVYSSDILTGNEFIIIAADVKYGIHKTIEESYQLPYCYTDPLLFSHYTEGRKEYVSAQYEKAAEKIDRVYDSLSDERSKQTFCNILLHRAVHDLGLLWEVFESKQYFGNDLIKEVHGGFADCGAYNGDTLKALIAQTGSKDVSYYAFEPEKDNLNALREYVQSAGLTNVRVYELGLWDRQELMTFAENDACDSLAWKLIEADGAVTDTIRVDSLDNVLRGKEISFIKMDIEGSELKALDGARQLIENNHPVLAISAYHELEHLWEVPLRILELRPACRLGYRHHSWNMADSVCYGI